MTIPRCARRSQQATVSRRCSCSIRACCAPGTFRRIFNPARQQERFDPGGSYVRRYVPELGNVPDYYLAEPWTMPDEVQREAGCIVGKDYPAPIVDHIAARRDALARYAIGGS